MYAIVIEFRVKESCERDFIRYWNQTTQYFLAHHGSLGSRLHKSENGMYVAYAFWPDKITYDSAHKGGHDCPSREKMRGTLVDSAPTILHKMNMMSDFIVPRPNSLEAQIE